MSAIEVQLYPVPAASGGGRMSTLKTIETNVLEIAFLDEGPAAGWPVVLAHGFPNEVHAYDEIVPG